MLFLSLYLLWILLCGKVTAEILLIGLPVAGLVFLFAALALNYPWQQDFRRLKVFPRVAGYLLYLLKEVLSCALRVARLVWSPGLPDSCLAEFDPKLTTEAGRVLLADSITLTPGTITVEAEEGHFLVHCLEKSSEGDLSSGTMTARVRGLEEKLK